MAEEQTMLVDGETLMRAMEARDRHFDGQALVCVTSTGIYCRFGCPARTPLRRNVAFRATVEACKAAGFRACKRCRPDEVGGGSGPVAGRRKAFGQRLEPGA
jgi:AraC family transcriptional regulator, regulatory protein of adaptative response / methylated-DNA-[protein]-cysteine methyltransferase